MGIAQDGRVVGVGDIEETLLAAGTEQQLLAAPAQIALQPLAARRLGGIVALEQTAAAKEAEQGKGKDGTRRWHRGTPD
ncbi:hypothetical protein thsps117_11090 [Pseudomonas sp. No.117]